MRPEIGALLLLRRARMVTRETVLEEAPDEEMTQAKELAEELGGLPLALDQAGAYSGRTPTDLCLSGSRRDPGRTTCSGAEDSPSLVENTKAAGRMGKRVLAVG